VVNYGKPGMGSPAVYAEIKGPKPFFVETTQSSRLWRRFWFAGMSACSVPPPSLRDWFLDCWFC
jgi:hypothetical protein